SSDVVEALHQEGAPVHPLLDSAEGVLDDLAAPRENVGPHLQASGPPVQHGTASFSRRETRAGKYPNFSSRDRSAPT
ncbi:MAG: hypothetical protein ACRECU_08600, partial [Methylocella sp.]